MKDKMKAVIFDLDGTLLDTLEDLADSTNYALCQMGYPKRTIKEVCQFVGNGVAKLIERAVPDGIREEEVRETLDIFRAYYSEHCQDKTKPYDGIEKLLLNLREKGIQSAIVSNKFMGAVKELSRFYFPEIIKVAIGEQEELGIRKKPAPDTVLMALEELHCKVEDAVYVGDSEVDIQTAVNSGMECLTVTWGFRDENFLLEQGAKYCMRKPCDIIKWIEERARE